MDRVEKLASELTLEEKVSLCGGRDFMSTNPVDRLGVPAMWVSDGPNGARGRSFSGPTSAWFPCGTALGATWDVELIERVGAAIGGQLISKGASVLLGPTMNIHRTPLAGRNFECYSEDPELSARIAVAFINGLQSRGVGACAKHFVCNDQEFERNTISSEVDERTLREIYLVPFEASVREARVWSVMTAYNRLNGTYCAEHPELLQKILRDEWGFKGFVISDWWGTKSTVPSANAGLDLEMPGPPAYYGDKLLDAVKNGDVSEETIDAKGRVLLETMERAGRFDAEAEPAEEALDLPEDRALLRKTAAEAMVLLCNEGSVLPLRDVRTLAVIGPNADVARIGGGGSSEMTPHYTVTPLGGIRNAFDGDVVFARGCLAYRSLPELPLRLTDGMTIEYFADPDLEGEPVRTDAVTHLRYRWLGTSPIDGGERFSARLRGTFTPDADGEWTFSLISAGRSRIFVDDEEVVDNWTDPKPGTAWFGMGSAEAKGAIHLHAGRSHALRIEFRAAAPTVGLLYVGCLPPMADDPIAHAAAVASEADAVVLVVGTSSEWESEGYDRDTMDLPGDQDELIARVAAANPNTAVVVNASAPVTMPWADGVPAIVQAWFPGQECGNAIADVLFGKVNPCGKLPTTLPKRLEDNPAHDYYPGSDGEVAYEEGVFVGYRHYDEKDVTPRFCFGHGLSYTTFEYGSLDAKRDGENVIASIDITNTGDVAGKEVVQLYVHDEEASVPRPPRELKAFVKLSLEPGETKTATFTLGPRAFSFWKNGWTLEPGTFELQCGSSSRDIRARARVGG